MQGRSDVRNGPLCGSIDPLLVLERSISSARFMANTPKGSGEVVCAWACGVVVRMQQCGEATTIMLIMLLCSTQGQCNLPARFTQGERITWEETQRSGKNTGRGKRAQA